MFKSTKRKIVLVLAITLALTAIPLSVSAASIKVLGKAQITSIKTKKASKSSNKGSMLVKWKKVKNATGYQIYVKAYSDASWTLAKKVGKRYTSIQIRTHAGKYYVKVRAIRKSGKKIRKGKFSTVKPAFIRSRMTLEEYLAFDDEVRQDFVNASEETGTVISAKGNNLIYTYDLSNVEGVDEDYAKSDSTISSLQEGLKNKSAEFKDIAKPFKNDVGITGVHVVVKYTWGNELILSKRF